MVYKGCEKRMIKIKSTGSELFEEVYFILSSKGSYTATRTDMVKEANRIISRAGLVCTEQPKSKKSIAQYLIGFLSGAGVVGLIMTLAF